MALPRPREIHTDLRQFTATCHAVARALGGDVVAVEPYRGTPTTFIRGSIRKPFGIIDVLCHRDLPLFALAAHGTTTFIDDPDLRAAWPHPIMTPADLNTDASRADPTLLATASQNDLRYWNPATVGDLLFNYWD